MIVFKSGKESANIDFVIGMDNGISGGYAIIRLNDVFAENPPITPLHSAGETPTFKQVNYTKKKATITRIWPQKLTEILEPYKDSALVYLERPMVNPKRFKATVSAVRSLEAMQIVFEQLEIPYCFIDSKEWQKNLKIDSKSTAMKCARDFGFFGRHQGIADAICIAAYAAKKHKDNRTI